MANLAAKTSWTQADAEHLARRAGFGLSPEAAAALAAQPIASAVGSWVSGSGLDATLFDAVWADRADPVWLGAVTGDAASGGADVPAVQAPHRYQVAGADAWRNDLARAQASWAFRMQFHPFAFAERMALFWHNLFATGHEKVQSTALMLGQITMFRRSAGGDLSVFEELLVAVSKDPAMAIWLDSVRNNASGTNVPNENYAREVMELYSLGADNGYSQDDITRLALALSGWSFTVSDAQVVASPARPTSRYATGGTFRVYDGSALPAGVHYRWDNLGTAVTTLPNRHVNATRGGITFLEQAFDVSQVPAGALPGQAAGEDALRSIVANRDAATSRRPRCAEFLARRLLTHFVTSRFSAQDLADVAARILALDFDLSAFLAELFQSEYFHDPANRFALVEGPVSWIVRAARALGLPLSEADQATPRGFPAWALVAPAFDAAGMRLLDPAGPNGWKEDEAWMNSTTMRARTRLAAALALGETFTQGSGAGNTHPLFPSAVDGAGGWFPAPPPTPLAVFDRLAALLQPAPIAPAVRDAWLEALWPGGAGFVWDGTGAGQKKARQLAFLLLCSPAGQRY